jgi:hypothetical protein
VPTVETWTQFVRRLRQIGLDMFNSSDVKVMEERAADLKVLALMLLARTLSNLQGVLVLLREKRIVEARTITRCCYEDHLWVNGLVRGGKKFRSEMVHHEMKHKRITMKTIAQYQVEQEEDVEKKIRDWMRTTKKWESSKTLTPGDVAKDTGDQSYLFYQLLSLDAHPSVETLNRYYEEADADGRPGIDVDPAIKEDEIMETLLLLSVPVLGVLMGVSNLLGKEAPGLRQAADDEYPRLMRETLKRV